MPKRKLRRIPVDDPTHIFDNLDELRKATEAASPMFSKVGRRERPKNSFTPVEHARARKLGRQRISGAAWWLLIELDRIMFKLKGCNPFKLSNRLLTGLRQLEKAGVISVWRNRGQAPQVLHHWFAPTRE